MQRIDTFACVDIQKYLLATNALLSFFYIVTLVIGLHFVITGKTKLGVLIYLIATGQMALNNVWLIAHEYLEISKRLIAVFHMDKLLSQEATIQINQDAPVLTKVLGQLELCKVDFSYTSRHKQILKKINMPIPHGSMVAVVGKTGEGKSTILKLLSRLYDVTGGAITLDGSNIKSFNLYWYRRLFATVSQEVDIFDTSIMENVRYAVSDATESDVIEAIRSAHLHEVVDDSERFPDGLLTEVGERGIRLSGGQKQRVGIARAYLALKKGARFLILDEATSDLDAMAERAVQEMIEKLRKKDGISIIVCAHRLATIQRADIIYVIDGGQIVESGDHKKLIQRNGLYAKLVDLQKIGEIRE
ncbi:MAG: ATP-binding cassette domain-containing protein [bacterium]|nr:ATP-binding cassette domain-containing protein [bacterium]